MSRYFLLVAMAAITFSGMQPPVVAQTCDLSSTNRVSFGRVFTNSFRVERLLLTNLGWSLEIFNPSIVGDTSAFRILTPLPSAIGANQSREIEIEARNNQNVRRIAHVFFPMTCGISMFQHQVTLTADFEHPDTLWAFTWNRWGSELVSSLRNYLSNHTSLSYLEARRAMFGRVDNRDGVVECIYTGRTIQTQTIPDPNQFNTEHSWPQSKGSDNLPEESDLNIIYPTVSTVNSRRSNFPFARVTRDISWQEAGSKLGQSDDISGTCFEPRDKVKGDISRAHFYFATRYGNKRGANDSQGWLTAQEPHMRLWNVSDPPDSLERLRNTSVAQIQGRRNPYIDHPEFMERVFNLSVTPDFPKFPRPDPSGTVVFGFPPSFSARSIESNLWLANTGSESARIIEASILNWSPATTNPDSLYTITVTDSTIDPGQLTQIRVLANHADAAARLRVRFADGVSSVSWSLVSRTAAMSVSPGDGASSIAADVFPNPFDNETSIRFSAPGTFSNQTRLVLYSMLGEQIADLTNLLEWQGDIAQARLSADAMSGLNSAGILRVSSPVGVASVLVVRAAR